MELHNLEIAPGARQARKRVGRGSGSGLGTTAGRGTKGQKARSGCKIRRGFEGGQMPLYRRLPKRGFKNVNRKEYAVVNIKDLAEHFDAGSTVSIQDLMEKNLLKKTFDGIKILGEGDLSKPLHIEAHRFSKVAVQKIQEAGGTVKELK